ncbi:MAG: hypothetical protein ACRD0W_22855 [Acidimicrobiales bacterium]
MRCPGGRFLRLTGGFEGFDHSVDLEQVEARQSDWATHLRYRVKK